MSEVVSSVVPYYVEINKKIQNQHSVDISQLDTLYEPENAQELISSSIEELQCSNEIKKRLKEEFFEYGPLNPLLEDSEITEISLNGPDSIWYEKEGRLVRHGDRFLSSLSYRNFILKLCDEARISINLERPFCDGKWKGFRAHLVESCMTENHTKVSLRSHPQSAWTLEKLKAVQWATPEDILRIQEIILERENFIIVGVTGTGKTSFLTACLQEVPSTERVICIEESSEIQLPNDASLKLLTRKDPNNILKDYEQTDLIKESLRMKPDRLIMGEVRGGEAKDYLLALSTGHRGAMGTLHGKSAREALLRLEILIQLGAPQWNVQTIRQLIFMGLKYIFVLEQVEGQRQLEGGYEITSLESTGFLLEQIL